MLWRINDTFFNLRVSNKNFVGLGEGTSVVATSKVDGIGAPETFQIVRNDGNRSRVHLQASNGQFLQAQSETSVTADYGGSSWDDNDPSVFVMKISRTLQGEYQIANGYSPDKARQILQDHWNTYVTEKDFIFLSKNGIDAVRIPVGWWIRYDQAPPQPFVGGSLQALDNAFTWAESHGMKVIVDLHAIQGSQNGNEHSGTRDGFLEWGESYLQDTVAVIDFLASRYANKPSLVAIELMNEPSAPGVNLDTLKKYYQQGYETVRKYTDAYVIFSNRLGNVSPTELLSFASRLNRVVIDVHYYNLFSEEFDGKDAQWNIDYINNQRASELNTVSTASPLSFVGEWTGAWNARSARMQEHKNFVKAQQDVYGHATFGWAYWAYQCKDSYWSLKWMIENNYIKV